MVYQCNGIKIDTLNYSLSKEGKSIAIEPKVFDVIAYLVTNRGRLVSRQEIFENIWGGKFVCDTSLSNHIKSARHVLGDNGHQQQIIKTIYGRGYQFIADTDTIISLKNPPSKTSLLNHKNITSPTPTLSVEVRHLSQKELKAPITYNLTQKVDEKNGKLNGNNNKMTIAVLAFEDISPEQNLEYFSDGISEIILNLLVKVPNLKVVSRTSSFSFKRKKSSIKTIGSELDVTHVLEGCVCKSLNNIRISTQLIEVRNGYCLWSETYQHDMGDIFEIQEEFAGIVRKELSIRTPHTC